LSAERLSVQPRRATDAALSCDSLPGVGCNA